MTENDLLLVSFDEEDANKILLKHTNKEQKILAITPNSLEILKNNNYKKIITPLEINKNIHEELAKDNLVFKEFFNNYKNKNLREKTLSDSFLNLSLQCFSSINYFTKFLDKKKKYLFYNKKNFEILNYNQLNNKLREIIIEKKYGIFKTSKTNNFQFYKLKKFINYFILFFLKKKKNIYFNFQSNTNKIATSHKIIEIKFGQLSKNRYINFLLIIKSFFTFFQNKKIKVIYPDISLKEDNRIKRDVEDFFNSIDSTIFNGNKSGIINFLYQTVLYENELYKFLKEKFDLLNVKLMIADHLTWLDTFVVAKYLRERNLDVILSSHGMIDYSDKKFEKDELFSLANGLCLSDKASHIVAQSPTAFKVAHSHLKKFTYEIIKAHPLSYNGLRKREKNQILKNSKFQILYAGTYKVFFSRPFIYQSSFEFLKSINKISSVINEFIHIDLTINIRTNDEINDSIFKKLENNNSNIKVKFNENIENLMQKSDLLITNFSTLIDEFSYLNKPIIIINDYLKFECYKHYYLNLAQDDNLRPIYYMNCFELKERIKDIINKIHNSADIKNTIHIWKTKEALNNNELLKKINELYKN